MMHLSYLLSGQHTSDTEVLPMIIAIQREKPSCLQRRKSGIFPSLHRNYYVHIGHLSSPLFHLRFSLASQPLEFPILSLLLLLQRSTISYFHFLLSIKDSLFPLLRKLLCMLQPVPWSFKHLRLYWVFPHLCLFGIRCCYTSSSEEHYTKPIFRNHKHFRVLR